MTSISVSKSNQMVNYSYDTSKRVVNITSKDTSNGVSNHTI